jgi:Effector-associated domain 1/CHAT domain
MRYNELRSSGYTKALAEAFGTAEKADDLLNEAEIPQIRLRPFNAHSPLEFWNYVCRELDNGLIVDGLRKLTEAAAILREGNVVLTQAVKAARAVNGSPLKILFLTANPQDTDHLRVNAEIREIMKITKDSKAMPRRLVVEFRLAVQPDDLVPALEDVHPTLVHFSGHGDKEGGIVLEDGRGGARFVGFAALGNLFARYSGNGSPLRCVVLNGCYTGAASPAINPHVDAVVGSSGEVADDSALEFARGFYTGLAKGESVDDAFERGKREMGLTEPAPRNRGPNPGVFNPEIIVATAKAGINLKELYL